MFYREVRRIGGNGTEKQYYVIFKKQGRKIEAKVGRQYADQMTPYKASRLRSDYIEGRKLTPQEQRLKDQQEAANITWTINRLWREYTKSKKGMRYFCSESARFSTWIGPYLGHKRPEDCV